MPFYLIDRLDDTFGRTNNTFYLTAHQGKEHCTEERFGELKAKAVEREIRKPYYEVKIIQTKILFC